MSYYPEDQDPAVSESEVNDFYNQIVEWIADNPSEVERDYSVKEVVSYLENYSECELDQLIIRKNTWMRKPKLHQITIIIKKIWVL